MNASNRTLVNSVILYVKTGITALISIFYSRYLLAALGVENYGIYNLVGGIIGMLGFITATLSNSGTRFIARSLGENNDEKTREVFYSVLLVTKKVVWVLVVGLEIAGLIFINLILNIPSDRMLAANIVYQFMIINMVYTVLTAPYSGLLFSREKIAFMAALEIADVMVRLLIAVLLIYSPSDRLIVYGALLMILSFVNRTVLKKYCKKDDIIFKKKNSHPNVNKEMTKNLLAFSGWNLLGSLGIIAQRQGTIFLVNIFFGVIVNAALGIATVVGNQLSNLSSSLLRAIQPQIFKSFGEEDKVKQEFLTFISSKMGVILLSFALVPLLIEIDYILNLWLVEVPEFSSTFIRLYLILTIMGHMSYGLTIAMQAHGRIKELQITTVSLQLLNIPIALILYKLGFPVYSIFIVTIGIEFVIFIARLFFAQRFIDLNLMKYVKNVIINPGLMIILAILLNFFIAQFFQPSVKRLSLLVFQNAIFIACYSYYLILNREEKALIKRVKVSIINKIRRK